MYVLGYIYLETLEIDNSQIFYITSYIENQMGHTCADFCRFQWMCYIKMSLWKIMYTLDRTHILDERFRYIEL